MGPKLEEGLRRLCCQYGWCYGIYWRPAVGESGLMTVGCSYYESQLGNMMANVLNQVHKVGKGVVGVTALDGRSNWVLLDTHFKECSFATSANNSNMFKDDGTWSLQFLAGIKTISILPVQPFGVLQFGSYQKILESLEFINHVKDTVDSTEFLSELLVCEDSQDIGEMHEPFGISTSAVVAGVSFSGHQDKEMNSIYNTSFSGVLPVQQCHRDSVIPSNYAVDFPNSSYRTVNNVNSITKESSFVSKHHQFSPSDDILAMMEQQLLKMIGSREFPSGIQPTAPHENMAHHMYGDSSVASVSNHNTGFNYARSGRESATDSLPSSPFRNQSSSKILPQESCFPVEENMESISFRAFSEDLVAEYATSSHSKPDAANNFQMDNFLKHKNGILTRPRNASSMVNTVSSSVFGGSCDLSSTSVKEFSDNSAEVLFACLQNHVDVGSNMKENYSDVRSSIFPEHDLYDGMEFDTTNCNQVPCYSEHIIIPEESTNYPNLNANFLDCIPQLDVGVMKRPQEDIFSSLEPDQLLDCVTACNTSSANSHSSAITHASRNQCSSNINIGNMPFRNQVPSVGLPRVNSSMRVLPECKLENIMQLPGSDVHLKSQLSSWIDDCYSLNAPATTHSKNPNEQSKFPRKRAKPGESARPRPKDRQLIQDRVKELREIVPNGAKCSIDALLDRTIKHMIYLQNVTQFAEKIKQTDESKMISDETGVVLRDNTNDGGATWAFEVAGQTMVCPIIVEDLSPPGQMLVEMLCEEHGFFLEIADIIRGFGLTILKGVMEVHNSKIWAKFLVEANREVTRMEIFLSLVQLLQQTSNNVASKQPTKVEMESDIHRFHKYNQCPLPIPISLPDRFQ